MRLSCPEIWKDVTEFDVPYQVSNYGKIKHNGKTLRLKNKQGYRVVSLLLNGKRKNISIHRIVAKTFLPNPNNFPVVNHKDEIKSNNFVWVNPDGTVDESKSNLEWCTQHYNVTYGTAIQKRSKPVLQYSQDYMFIARYHSITEAQKQTGVSGSMICKCCRGKIENAGSYIWRYETITPVTSSSDDLKFLLPFLNETRNWNSKAYRKFWSGALEYLIKGTTPSFISEHNDKYNIKNVFSRLKTTFEQKHKSDLI